MNTYLSNFNKVAFGLALAIGLASCNQGAGSGTPAAGNDSTKVEVVKKEKIVYVNSDTLSEQYAYFKDIRTKLEAKAKKAQNDLQAKGQAFQREVAEAEKNVATMSAAERQATEERLARKQQELAQLNQNASNSLAQDEATEFNAVYTAITEYLKKHAEEKGYQFVLTYSKTNPAVLYADPKLDITTEVLTALNKEYDAKKTTEKK
ncbi:OmpH family outer membrane protein [Parapedobacter sp. SGR-10]|uniref:OmpH family outer membrane protein n=1 Tax=Parapedobacter sp. SGR-10 TaxID=2710879 RepID=UPI0013D6CA32|nr:OmpH family outer membrane protein [Parapedobacter sp. SGR-10]NGF55012.1 OmpH family outer membrane protein [Parapedobacter sp. SGR-10]